MRTLLSDEYTAAWEFEDLVGSLPDGFAGFRAAFAQAPMYVRSTGLPQMPTYTTTIRNQDTQLFRYFGGPFGLLGFMYPRLL